MDIMHKNANFFFFCNNYKKALDLYDILISNNYMIDTMYSNKAACYLKLKEYKNSLQQSLKSLEINLNSSVVWGRVGYSYKGLKMYYESLNAFKIAFKLNNNNKIYYNEIIFLKNKIDNKINIKNVFNVLLNNKILFNNLKKIKNDFINNNFNINNILSNKNIINLIDDILIEVSKK